MEIEDHFDNYLDEGPQETNEDAFVPDRLEDSELSDKSLWWDENMTDPLSPPSSDPRIITDREERRVVFDDTVQIQEIPADWEFEELDELDLEANPPSPYYYLGARPKSLLRETIDDTARVLFGDTQSYADSQPDGGGGTRSAPTTRSSSRSRSDTSHEQLECGRRGRWSFTGSGTTSENPTHRSDSTHMSTDGGRKTGGRQRRTTTGDPRGGTEMVTTPSRNRESGRQSNDPTGREYSTDLGDVTGDGSEDASTGTQKDGTHYHPAVSAGRAARALSQARRISSRDRSRRSPETLTTTDNAPTGNDQTIAIHREEGEHLTEETAGHQDSEQAKAETYTDRVKAYTRARMGTRGHPDSEWSEFNLSDWFAKPAGRNEPAEIRVLAYRWLKDAYEAASRFQEATPSVDILNELERRKLFLIRECRRTGAKIPGFPP